MTTVLITGIGGDISQGVALLTREYRGDYRLVGTDIHPDHGGKLFVDALFQIPPATDPDYVRTLSDLIASQGVDVIIPMTEPELAAINPCMSRYPDKRWITVGPTALAAGIDKLATVRALERLRLPAPWTIPIEDGLPDSYPCILKDRFGSGSRSVVVIKNRREAECMARSRGEAVFQELLEPPNREVTCAVYRTRDGRVATLQLLRRLAGGFTGWARVIRDPATEEMCRRLAEGLDLQGSMNVQLRITESGPRVFEINPRFSSTALMRHKLGFSDVVWTLDEAEGRSVTFPDVPEGRVVIRVQDAAVLD